MRVALLSHSAPAGDAIGRQLAEKVAFFQDRGFQVRLFVETDRRLVSSLRPVTRQYSPIRTTGEDWRYLCTSDLIVVEYSQYFGLLELLPLLQDERPKIVFDYHGVTPPQFACANHRDQLERGRRMRGLAWTADAAIVHSRFARDELFSESASKYDRSHSIGYPIDSTWFVPGRPESPLRKRLGLPNESQLLLFVGRLAPNKRACLLIEAIAQLRDSSPVTHAVFIGDCSGPYSAERDRCRERAARLGVADRLHFVGQVSESQLRDAYRDADALVIPSVHEGFCIPAVEAMACGTPVIASRSAALPETIADAGLTFAPNDAEDLARQVRRLQSDQGASVISTSRQKRVAIVSARFGDGFAGGAESSLRTLAKSMSTHGHTVDVFTLGASRASSFVDGIKVHRFCADPTDAERFAAAAHAIRLPGGMQNTSAIEDYLQESPRSKALIEAMLHRGPFDAVVVGPYAPALTRDVVEAFRDRVLVVPCFHDEPSAYLPQIRAAFQNVGGMLYHSHEERQFAQAVLGLNHPNSHVIGALIDTDTPGEQIRGRKTVGTGRRYVMYCGRYCREKGLPEFLAYAQRYCDDRPNRFTIAFCGEGNIAIPNRPWACDLGFVDERTRRDVMAGSDALVLLSNSESLSLVTLEAMAQGTPVIVSDGCDVMREHAAHGAGIVVDGYDAFAAALDDLWEDPEHWREMGRAGREYVRQRFSNGAAYVDQWQAALNGLDISLSEQLLVNGVRRAQSFDRETWRRQFANVVESVLEAPKLSRNHELHIEPRATLVTASSQQDEALIPIRVTNRGQFVEVGEGPGRIELVATLTSGNAASESTENVTPIPRMLAPHQSVAAMMRVSVPLTDGEYQVSITCRRWQADGSTCASRAATSVRLVIDSAVGWVRRPAISAALDPVLRSAQAAGELPTGYVDVSEGRLAALKRWVKRKLLHNFQAAYVDVLARQQTAFNGQVISALAELGDGQAAIASSMETPKLGGASIDVQTELRRLRKNNRRLRRRLARLETLVTRADAEETPT